MSGLLREGERVDVVGGALAGLGGVVRAVDPFAGRAEVDLVIAGRTVPATFGFALLRRAQLADAEPGAAADGGGTTGCS